MTHGEITFDESKESLSQLRPKKLSQGSDGPIRRKQHVMDAHSWWECRIV